MWEEALKEWENPNGYSKVYYGPGELGAVNAVLLGSSFYLSALDHAKGIYSDRGNP